MDFQLKLCAVPMCFSKSPDGTAPKEKLFFPIPKDRNTRKQWFDAMNRTTIPHNTVFHVCEDHFDLENDVIGYDMYTEIGNTIKLKPGVLPHLFKCQNETSVSGKVTSGREEMERFKRRLIRSVARLLIVEKKTEEEAWVQLKKETGCNCKALWQRMQALTIKKLQRLLEVDDVIESIPKGARMSFTDWLLFDLILAHQDIDLIDKDKAYDLKPMEKLFKLVKKFKVEELYGDDLIEAWSMLTVAYNKTGHQCSPMLLQRRWYQLKQATRDKFYNFWQSYRGHAKRLESPEVETPTPLQVAIATWDKSLVTSPFTEWEELIKKRRVIMPDEFERLMKEKIRRTGQTKKQTSDETPDLEVIEPKIETIDIDSDEDVTENPENEIPDLGITIKEEPLDFLEDETSQESKKNSIYDDVLIATTIDHEQLEDLENTHIPTEDIDKDVVEVEPIENMEPVLPQITNVFGNVEVNSENLSIISALSESSNVVNPVIETTDNLNPENSENNCSSDDDVTVHDPSNIETVIEETKPNIQDININIENVIPKDTENAPQENFTPDIEIKTENIKETQEISDEDMDDIIIQNEPSVIENDPPSDDVEMVPETEKIIKNEPIANDVADMVIDHDNIIRKTAVAIGLNDPNIDSDISVEDRNKILENKEKQIDCMINFSLGKLIEETINNKNPEGNRGFSFGELPKDISFADDGIEFLDDGIAYCEDDVKETFTIKSEAEEEGEEEKTLKICKKLEMIAIVYTTKLEDMGVFSTYTDFDHIENKGLIDLIASKSKPILPQQEEVVEEVEKDEEMPVLQIKQEIKTEDVQNDEEPMSDDGDSDEDIITDKERVKMTSYLLQKPRSRVYTPIQLCKNPDFNTRLKRLTVGFLSSPRNRLLIKTLKPLTIDLSKTFETKLKAGTLYLKDGDKTIKEEPVTIDNSSHNASVVPSAMPAQSLIDHSVGDVLPIFKQAMESSSKPIEEPISNERSKVINLPDISEIRRINQKLLTAEVTPIQVNAVKPFAPVSIVNTSVGLENKSLSAQGNIGIDADIKTNNSGGVNIRRMLNDELVNIPDTSQPHLSTSYPFHKSYNAHNPSQALGQAIPQRGQAPLMNIPDTSQSHCSTSYPFNKPYNTPNPNQDLGQGIPLRGHATTRGHASTRGQAPTRGQAKRGRGQARRETRPVVPWFKGKSNHGLTIKSHDYLLTMDTLYKMLYVLNKEDSLLKGLPKKKKKGKKKDKEAEMSDEVHVIDDNDKTSDDVQLIEPGSSGISPKPKLTVSYAENYPNNKNNVSALRKIINQSNKKMSLCCWSRYRMCRANNKTFRPHDCQSVCTCCCKSLLEHYLVNETKLKATRMNEAVQSIASKPASGKNEIGVVSSLEKISDTGDQNSIIVDAEIPATDIETTIEVSNNTMENNVGTGTNVATETNPETPFKIYGTPVTVLELPETGSTALMEVPVSQYGQTSVLDSSHPVIDLSNTTTEDLTQVVNVANTSTEVLAPLNANSITTQVISPMMFEPNSQTVTPVAMESTTQVLTPVLNPNAQVVTPAVVNTDTSPVVDITNEQNDEVQPIEIDDRSPEPVSLSDNKSTENTSPKVVSVCSESTLQEIPVKKPRGRRSVPVTCVPNSKVPMLSVGPDNGTHLPNIVPPTRILRNLVNVKKRKMPVAKKFEPAAGQLQALKTYKPPANLKEKMIYLNSKQISDRPSNNPIFLGKNKILLTTVKFPPNLKTFEMVKRNMAPQLQLPAGVQLILLPDCTVTCTYDSNVNLSDEEKAALPKIVTAVQDQINAMSAASSVPPPNCPVPPQISNEIVNLDDDDDTPSANNNPVADAAPEPNNPVSNENVLNTSTETAVAIEGSNKLERQQVPESQDNTNEENITKVPDSDAGTHNENVNAAVIKNVGAPTAVLNEVTPTGITQNKEVKSSEVSENTDSATTVIDESSTNKPQTTEENNKLEDKTNKTSTVSKTKNILSDLMEMSGISEEDMAPTQEVPLAVPQVPVAHPAIAVKPINMPPKVGELSPITSLTELKYACQNNGAFFKLDFDTGYLVPINVCMKQTPKIKPSPGIIEATKSVIDLTEEDEPANVTNKHNAPKLVSNEPSFTVNTQSSPSKSLLISSANPETVQPVKPIKLFKSLPSILRRNLPKTDAALKAYQGKKRRRLQEEAAVDIEDMLPTPTKLYKPTIESTTTVNAQIEVTQTIEADQSQQIYMPIASGSEIQLMTVLTENQGTDASINKPVDQIPLINDDSESDDEPLAIIAKRNRQERLTPINAIEIELNDEVPKSQEGDDTPKSQDVSMDSDDCGIFLDLEDGDSTEENCILGV